MTPRDIDLATIKTWPAAVTEERDGWFYLAAGGVTGRVNAVWPLDWTGADAEAAIAEAENWYAALGLPPRFKLTDNAFAPCDLAERLARRGYECVMPTLIMTCSLSARSGRPEDADHEDADHGDADHGDADHGGVDREGVDREGVDLAAFVSPAFDQALRESTTSADDLEERRSIAQRVPSPAAFATRQRGGRVVAIGASAVAGKLAGVFLMRTVPDERRRGHALHILRALADWAAARGADHAFLQVDAGNAPAIALYEREGFAALTTYRFWRKAA